MMEGIAMKVRRAARALTAAEWEDFVQAFRNMREGLFKGVAKPTLDDFADEHAAVFKDKNHDWYVHSHGDGRVHWGLMFLAWHRVFLNEFENRLRREVPGVTLPYWNAFKSPVPAELKKITDHEGAVICPADLRIPDFAQPDFEVFQHDLEVGYHNAVHSALGRTLGRRHSPRDALFWLHHAFVDRQWGHWSQKHNGAVPPSLGRWIKGDQIVKGKKLEDVLHTWPLGYVYDNGVYGNLRREGAATFAARLKKDTILSADLGDDVYAKIRVFDVTRVAAFLTLQPFRNGIPMAKLGVCPPSTTYVDLRAGKFDVPREQAHVRIVKTMAGSEATYTIETVNGTRLAVFTGITDFTANGGEGATDYEMLYI
jgi:hypothetical protein